MKFKLGSCCYVMCNIFFSSFLSACLLRHNLVAVCDCSNQKPAHLESAGRKQAAWRPVGDPAMSRNFAPTPRNIEES